MNKNNIINLDKKEEYLNLLETKYIKKDILEKLCLLLNYTKNINLTDSHDIKLNYKKPCVNHPTTKKKLTNFVIECFNIIENNKNIILLNENINKEIDNILIEDNGTENINKEIKNIPIKDILTKNINQEIENIPVKNLNNFEAELKKERKKKKKRLQKKRICTCGSGKKYIKCCKLLCNNNNPINCNNYDSASCYIDPYKQKIDNIINFIKSKYPNIKFKLIKNDYTNIEEIIFIDYKANMSILETTELSSIELRINSIINKKNSDLEECMICCNEMITNVSCNKCANNYCVECYIKIYENGRGIITCPFCRFSYGNLIPSHLIKLGIQQIKNKLYLHNGSK